MAINPATDLHTTGCFSSSSETRACLIGCAGQFSGIPKDFLAPIPLSQGELFFTRDIGIRRLDGSFLLPYPLRLHSDSLFKAMQPESGNQLIDSRGCGFGEGWLADKQEIAKKYFGPCVQGSSVIEGGNCFLFRSQENLPTAIIGLNSVILTLLALQEQGRFADLRGGRSLNPSEWAFRMARNETLHQVREPYDQKIAQLQSEVSDRRIDSQKRASLQQELLTLRGAKTQAVGTDTAYKEAIKAPLKPEEREEFRSLALQFEAKIQIAKEAIAHDLDLPIHRIAFLRQERFHIDLEAFVVEGTVFLNSEQLVQSAIGEPGRNKNLHDFLGASIARTPLNRANLENNSKAIEALGCKVVYTPGVFEGNTATINFMNALIRGRTIFTNGAPDRLRFLEKPFAEIVKRADLSLDATFVGDGVLSDILFQNRGGLHCLTQE